MRLSHETLPVAPTLNTWTSLRENIEDVNLFKKKNKVYEKNNNNDN